MSQTDALRGVAADKIIPHTTDALSTFGGSNVAVYVLVGAMILCVVFTFFCLLYLNSLEQEAAAGEKVAVWQPRRSANGARLKARMPKNMNTNDLPHRPTAQWANAGGTASGRGRARAANASADNRPPTGSGGAEMKPTHLRVVRPGMILPGQGVADMSTQDKSGLIMQYVYENVAILGEVRRRINSLELLMGERMYLANRTVNHHLLKARRISRAVESRLAMLEQMVGLQTVDQIERAYTLVCTDISVPKDAINALLSDDAIEPLAASGWNDTVEYLLYDAESNVKLAIND